MHHVQPILSPAVIIFPACPERADNNNPADRRQASKLQLLQFALGLFRVLLPDCGIERQDWAEPLFRNWGLVSIYISASQHGNPGPMLLLLRKSSCLL